MAHLVLVAWLTLRPLDVPWMTPPNLTPLAGIRADLALGWPQAARRIGEAVALLAPLGCCSRWHTAGCTSPRSRP